MCVVAASQLACYGYAPLTYLTRGVMFQSKYAGRPPSSENTVETSNGYRRRLPNPMFVTLHSHQSVVRCRTDDEEDQLIPLEPRGNI